MTSTNPTVWRAAMEAAGVSCARKRAHVECGKILAVAAQQHRIDAGPVVVHALIERTAERPEKCVEDRTVELRRTVIGHQRVEAVCGAGLDLLAVMRGEMAERGSRLAVDIGAGREPQRQPQLVEIVLVRKRQVLVKPFRREHFGGGAPLRTAVGKLDTNAHETLRRLGQRHHAEPKRHTQVDVSLEETDLAHAEQGRNHAIAAARRRPSGRLRPGRGPLPRWLPVSHVPRPRVGQPNRPFGDFRPSDNLLAPI